MKNKTIAILGGGNLGQAITRGLLQSGMVPANKIWVTKRHTESLNHLKKEGIHVTGDNLQAVLAGDIIILAVQPQQMECLLEEIASRIIPERHLVISVITGVSIDRIASVLPAKTRVVRAMPNTAISIRQSMTCLCCRAGEEQSLKDAELIFKTVGKTMVIPEELMGAATVLGACGVAFFLRAIRAASQGGIEIGFHAEEAIRIAAQTAKGAAELLLTENRHPEFELDKVTTPRGITISGLNEMEHNGFSSAMIKGIVTSNEKAGRILKKLEIK
ncbi:MAG: pyrroline-5-carboxylate reductase [Calditrichia bacterium]